MVMLTVGFVVKPDMRIEAWAHKQALERLQRRRKPKVIIRI